MNALTFSRFGGAEVLEYQPVPDPLLKPGNVLVKMKTIGLNYADIYRRRGNYHLVGNPPFIAGYEGAGIVIDANHCPEFKNGDRVAFADMPFANAELVALPVDHAILLPDELSFETACSVLLQGLTAQFLVNDSHLVIENEIVVIHAASGGVGQMLTQMCKVQKATVIGLTSSDNKRAVITARGADVVFNLHDDWKSEIKAFTHGKGADVVYDSVGSTLTDSLEVTRVGGCVVFYGMSGGNPPLVDPRGLMNDTKTLVGGDLWGYLTSKEERIRRANRLFDAIIGGEIKINAPTLFKLSEGRSAHEFLESGMSAGKVLLIPDND